MSKNDPNVDAVLARMIARMAHDKKFTESNNNNPKDTKKSTKPKTTKPKTTKPKLTAEERKIASDEKKRIRKEQREKDRLERQIQKKIAKEKITQMKNIEKERKRREKEINAIARKKKAADALGQKRNMCNDAVADNLSIYMHQLVPSKDEIKNLTQKKYMELRANVSEHLKGIRKYAMECNKNYNDEKVVKNMKKKTTSENSGALNIPIRDIFIPDIGTDVPDEVEITEEQFEAARKRLQNRGFDATNVVPIAVAEERMFKKIGNATALPVKKKKRIAPTLLV